MHSDNQWSKNRQRLTQPEDESSHTLPSLSCQHIKIRERRRGGRFAESAETFMKYTESPLSLTKHCAQRALSSRVFSALHPSFQRILDRFQSPEHKQVSKSAACHCLAVSSPTRQSCLEWDQRQTCLSQHILSFKTIIRLLTRQTRLPTVTLKLIPNLAGTELFGHQIIVLLVHSQNSYQVMQLNLQHIENAPNFISSHT